MGDKRTKTNSEPESSSPFTWHGSMVKRVAGTTFPRLARALALAIAVVAGAAAPPFAIAAGETSAEIIFAIKPKHLNFYRQSTSLLIT
jgi:hypothetical protein